MGYHVTLFLRPGRPLSSTFRWISSNDKPGRFSSGSEMLASTNSWYRNFWGRERSAKRWSLQKTLLHPQKYGASPLGLRRLSASGWDFRLGKVTLTLCPNTHLPSTMDLWRCPWCSRYRLRKWTRRHEFKSWTRLIAFHIVLIPLGKVWIQLFSLQLWVNSRTD